MNITAGNENNMRIEEDLYEKNQNILKWHRTTRVDKRMACWISIRDIKGGISSLFEASPACRNAECKVGLIFNLLHIKMWIYGHQKRTSFTIILAAKSAPIHHITRALTFNGFWWNMAAGVSGPWFSSTVPGWTTFSWNYVKGKATPGTLLDVIRVNDLFAFSKKAGLGRFTAHWRILD